MPLKPPAPPRPPPFRSSRPEGSGLRGRFLRLMWQLSGAEAHEVRVRGFIAAGFVGEQPIPPPPPPVIAECRVVVAENAIARLDRLVRDIDREARKPHRLQGLAERTGYSMKELMAAEKALNYRSEILPDGLGEPLSLEALGMCTTAAKTRNRDLREVACAVRLALVGIIRGEHTGPERVTWDAELETVHHRPSGAVHIRKRRGDHAGGGENV